jgi:hypothetical protein
MVDVTVAPSMTPTSAPTTDEPSDLEGQPQIEESPRADPRPDGMSTWWSDPWSWAAGLVVAFGRWVEAADRHMFHLAPDEPGQLAMARWLSGGPRWNMFDHLTWRPGYAAVLAPLSAVIDDGERLVRAALTLNAVLAGISAMVLIRILARWTDLGPRGRAAVAAVVALAPTAISASAYVWAESLISLLFLATLLALQQLIDDHRFRTAVIAVALGACAMTVHGRSLPMLPMSGLLAAVLLLRDRRWQAAGGVLGVAALLGFVSLRFTEWVERSVWDDPGSGNTADTIISRLDAPVALLQAFVGQAWYQLVATLGLMGIGTGVVFAALVRPTERFGRWHSITVIFLTGPLAFASIAFMSARNRPDQLVYGRYIDAVVWPITALGLAWVVRRLRPTRPLGRSIVPPIVAGLTLAAGVVVAIEHGDQLADDVGLRMMIPGLLPFIGSGGGIPVVRITLIAVAVLVLLTVLGCVRNSRRVPSLLLLVAAATIVVWSGFRVHDAQTTYLNAWAIGDDIAEIDDIMPAGAPIGVVMLRDNDNPSWTVQRQRLQVYQFYLSERHPFVWERTPDDVAADFVFAPTGTSVLRDAGGTIRWRDPSKAMALWELPAGR